jgi:hypothetical protein
VAASVYKQTLMCNRRQQAGASFTAQLPLLLGLMMGCWQGTFTDS